MRATGRQGRDGAEEGDGGPLRANAQETRPEALASCVILTD